MVGASSSGCPQWHVQSYLAHGGGSGFSPDRDPHQNHEPAQLALEALSYISALLDLLQITVGEAQTWEPFQTLVARQQLGGNDVPDAWLASYCLATGAVVVTFDKGFKKLLPRSQVMLLSQG